MKKNDEEEQMKMRAFVNERESYNCELIKLFLAARDRLEELFLEFHKKPLAIYALHYNGVQITFTQFLDLLGIFLFLPPDCSSEKMYFKGISEKIRKKKMIGLENFLKKIPGIELPPRPEKVDAWLNEKEEDHV